MAQNAFAQTAPTLNIQGVLRNSNQTAVDNGIYKIKFSLYTAESGGTAVWSEVQDSVNVSGGVYSTALGKVTPITAAFDQTYYLGVKVGSGTLPVSPIDGGTF
jgi:methenyltetrahydromethanopterin cyclohydrolase